MKKFLFSLVALMTAMTVQAQSICGSWQSVEPEVKNQKNDSYSTFRDTYTFNEDGTFSLAADITYSTKPAPTKEREVALAAYVKGTYTLSRNKMVMKVDFNSLKLEMVSISENGKVVNAPEILAAFNETFINDETRAKAAKEFKKDTYTVQLNDGGSILQLTDANGKVEKLKRIPALKN